MRCATEEPPRCDAVRLEFAIPTLFIPRTLCSRTGALYTLRAILKSYRIHCPQARVLSLSKGISRCFRKSKIRAYSDLIYRGRCGGITGGRSVHCGQIYASMSNAARAQENQTPAILRPHPSPPAPAPSLSPLLAILASFFLRASSCMRS